MLIIYYPNCVLSLLSKDIVNKNVTLIMCCLHLVKTLLVKILLVKILLVKILLVTDIVSKDIILFVCYPY